jgi:hypothetical protein
MSTAAIFDTNFYLTNNADVVVAISQGQFSSALNHFSTFGGKELRAPNASFDPSYYAINNPDVLNAVSAGTYSNVFTHYQEFGETESRAPSVTFASFTSAAYLTANPDVANAVTAGSFSSALDHYIAFGQNETRTGSGLDNSGSAAVTGSTFTLTTSIDSITGTANNDVIVGNVGTGATLSLADQINGGEGTDIIKVYSDGAVVLPDMTSVESAYIQDTITDTFSFTTSGLTAIEIDKATTLNSGTETVYTLAAGQVLTLDSITDGDATDDTASNNGEVDIATAAAVTSLSVVLDGVGASGALDDVDLDFTGTGLATLNLSTVGTTTSYLGILNVGAKLTTLNVSGSARLDADEEAVTTLTTIDASNMTAGGLTANITGASSVLTYTGSGFADAIEMGASYASTDVMDGGAGTDTLSIAIANADPATAQTNVTNFETLKINNGATNDEVDLAKFGTTQSLEVAVDFNGALTVSGMLAGGTIKTGTAVDNGDFIVAVTDATGAGDAITFDIDNTTGASAMAWNLTGIEDLTIDASGSTQVNVITITDAQLGTITAKAGAGNLDLNGASTYTVMTSVDASGTTKAGGLLIDLSASAVQGATITGTKNADTIGGSSQIDTIIAGGGTDNITSKGGADIITLTETTSVADTLVYNESGLINFDTVTGFTHGTVDDLVEFGKGNIVDNGSGNDTLSTMNGVDINASVAAGAMVAETVTVNTGLTAADATNLLFFSNTAATTFATAIGSASVVATTGTNTGNLSAAEGVAGTWYDSDDGTAVYGYIEDDTTNGTAITSADTFHEVARIAMSTADYTMANIDASFTIT